MLSEFAKILGLTREITSELLVVGLGSVGTLAAAVAAWSAARATKQSVEEMKQARFQATRPVLAPSLAISAYTVTWTKDGMSLRAGEQHILSQHDDPAVGCLSFTNVGAGAALQIKIENTQKDIPEFNEVAIGYLREFFDRGGYYFSDKITRSVSLQLNRRESPTPPYALQFTMIGPFIAGATHTSGIDICVPEQKIGIPFDGPTILAAIADYVGAGPNRPMWALTRGDLFTVSYTSIANEQFKHCFLLRMGCFALREYDGDNELEFEPYLRSRKGNWNKIVAEVHFSVEIVPTRGPSWWRRIVSPFEKFTRAIGVTKWAARYRAAQRTG